MPGGGANHYGSNLLGYVTTMFTCLIWNNSIYRDPHFWLQSTLNCSLRFNHHMKIFSETSVDLKISMACHSHSLFDHCRLFIISSRQIFPIQYYVSVFLRPSKSHRCLIMPLRFS